jgi:hypothetical protein
MPRRLAGRALHRSAAIERERPHHERRLGAQYPHLSRWLGRPLDCCLMGNPNWTPDEVVAWVGSPDLGCLN